MPTRSKNPIEHFIVLSKSSLDIVEINALLQSIVIKFGITSFVFYEYKTEDNRLISFKHAGNIATEASSKYIKANAYIFDPFLDQKVTGMAPITMKRVFEQGMLTPNLITFRDAMLSLGVVDSFGVPMYGEDGAMGLMAFYTRQKAEIARRHHATLAYLALFYRSAVCRLFPFEPQPLPLIKKLTKRQLECLRWISKGKSDWETSQILGISESTVNRHVEMAKERFNVNTRMQLVIEALRTGQLSFQSGVQNAKRAK